MTDLKPYAWLSIAAAVVTIALKTWAWRLTGSVGLLSDALESLVNLAGAAMTLWMLTIAAQPEDEKHAFGHGKAEYFASGFEGFLILFAALSIAVAAVGRLFSPVPLASLGMGVSAAAAAALVNFAVARVLRRAGRRHHAIALTGEAEHLLTDVWTSVGVIAGVAAVRLTGWLWLDPLLALAVAGHIAWVGAALLYRSASGLMDSALPPRERERIEAALAPYRAQGLQFHALRTREAGMRAFVSLHVLVPGAWTVQRGHDQVEEIEAAIRRALPRAHVTTHLEPLEDPLSQEDLGLDRDREENREDGDGR
ncbi:MAG: cation diffusion facilitator family transporter [Zoogloeaceae bacterium]|jgi:cation diffusion facilitator family transporter|nr:cation diffusion facilitator family transporter [Zoogloeaceae bacterium]